MQSQPSPAMRRASVDLSAYPDLVVIYLGIRVNRWRGLKAMMGIGPDLGQVVAHKPDGLLVHENVVYGLNHFGMRQYWRDMDSLEAFTRSEPHRTWWREFLKDGKGVGFWHETYRRNGGMEAIYLDMPPIGFAAFAPALAPVGPFMTARGRTQAAGAAAG